ncbi:hexokinase type 2-like isoform X2 [Ctenocephalides felis]|uniref:hexokinase type 2-like isoform X2 n=1 Tax=Ctenocephalides felis TaxID=7515 RepID=UPI000E6E2A47|nr:hexokinase type 2-like isoform X2 [Ctenocephalides felis]
MLLQCPRKIRERCNELVLSNEKLKEIMVRLDTEIQKGLSRKHHDSAIVKCFITYVQNLPNGEERGKFLALDLGGTNFRVLLITLGENREFQMASKIYAISESIMTGSGDQLFDHIADCLAKFIKEHKVEEETLPLGFTFSFPLKQISLTKGLLVRWTKGFNCSGVVGQDVVTLLKEAIKRRGDIKIDVCAILNDTTGTLMSCAWKNTNCRIGLIVGTGTNACYVENLSKAELFEGDSSGDRVLINTEWGAFGDNGVLDDVRSQYDIDVDEHSINPGKQLFEKMISGMYMGELARLAIVRFAKEGLLFDGKLSSMLMKRGNFFTKYVSEIEADGPGQYANCREILDELGLSFASNEDCKCVREICELVSRRAADLVSAAVSTLICRTGETNVIVGIDGGVYRYHPHFRDLMMNKIGELLPEGIQFDLMLSQDGSGRGAALVAAVASRT